MSPAVTLRRAVPGDRAALGRLGAILVAVHHAYDPDRFIAPGPETARGYGDFLVSQLATPEAVILVAESAGEVLGYVYAALEGDDWIILRGPAGVIYDIAVDPERRSDGVGRALLERVIEVLRERGAPQVVLSAAANNAGAQALFARLGFRPTMVEMTRDWPAGADRP